MLNPEGSHPEYFEELCAVAASGQISEPEMVEFQDHVGDCVRCRTAYAEFVDLLHNKLPLVPAERSGSGRRPGVFWERSSYRERFLARARRLGLAVPNPPRVDTGWRPIGFTPAAALAMALSLTAVVLGYGWHRTNARYTALAAEMASLRKRVKQPDSTAPPAPQIQPARPLLVQADPAPPQAPVADVRLEEELNDLRRKYADTQERTRGLEDQLRLTASDLDGFRTRQEVAVDSRNQLEKKLAEAELTLNSANDELRKVRQARTDDEATVGAQLRKIRELSGALEAKSEALERQTSLLAASRDIHDLMGARNLHIVDVLDVDSKGKDKRAFGRVFYTEEKSLIFYAFDLGDRSTTRHNASFQVWGARGPAQKAAQNLGIFYVDDQRQNRWVLKFEGPKTLAEIDSVFVTVEPQGGSARPTGRKFLYAYLKANPNHP
jgi:Anti-sigma-K factor rskA, C-terminal